MSAQLGGVLVLAAALLLFLAYQVVHAFERIDSRTGKPPWRDYGRRVLVVTYNQPIMRGRAVWVHGDKRGSPVLIENSSWRTIIGWQWRIGAYTLWFQFRRFRRD